MGLLHDAGLADIYLRDIHGLNDLLDAMGQRGMPVDGVRRLEATRALEVERLAAMTELQTLIPAECCPKKVYKKQPKVSAQVTQKTVVVTYCAYCQARKPNKKHTCWQTRPVKAEQVEELVQEWYVRLPFVPSPKGLLTYFKYKGYVLPSKYDRATGQKRFTSDEGALLRIALRYEDLVCAAVLRFREVDKQLSTYVGRPVASDATEA